MKDGARERLFRWQRLEIKDRCRYEPSETMFDRYPAPSLGARRVLRMAFLIEITLEDIVSLSPSRWATMLRLHPLSSVIGRATSWSGRPRRSRISDRSIDRSTSSPLVPLSLLSIDRSSWHAWKRGQRLIGQKKKKEKKNQVFHHLGTRYIVRGALKESFSYPWSIIGFIH